MSDPPQPAPDLKARALVRARSSDAMTRYAQGELGALAELYAVLAPSLQRYFLRTTRSRPLTEDLLQQTFMNVHAARGTFREGADAIAWVFAIGHRLLVDEARRSRRSVQAGAAVDGDSRSDEETTPESVTSSHELARRLDAELARLPEANRIAFELVRLEGLTMAEAAERLSTTPNAVKLRAHRADEALREVALDDEDEKPR